MGKWTEWWTDEPVDRWADRAIWRGRQMDRQTGERVGRRMGGQTDKHCYIQPFRSFGALGQYATLLTPKTSYADAESRTSHAIFAYFGAQNARKIPGFTGVVSLWNYQPKLPWFKTLKRLSKYFCWGTPFRLKLYRLIGLACWIFAFQIDILFYPCSWKCVPHVENPCLL